MLSDIVETPPNPAEARAVISLKNMYLGCMDLDTIETVGLSPVLEAVAEGGDMGGWPMVQNNWNSDRLDSLFLHNLNVIKMNTETGKSTFSTFFDIHLASSWRLLWAQ